ncbi:carbohydrate porin [bacterium]|nr:carbohydrate porin [bacterium]
MNFFITQSPKSVIGNSAKKLLVLAIFFGLTALLSPTLSRAEELAEKQTFFTQDTLTGNWGGLRDDLSDKGFDFEFIYTGDVFGNISGGIDKKAVYLGALDMTLSIDTEKLFKWKGGQFFFYGTALHGGSPSLHSGDGQGVSNIDALDAGYLMEAWFQQKLFDDKFSFLVGLYDLNSEFDAIDTAGLFINSSPGMGPDFSQSGLNGPSAWPATSLALRLYYAPIPQVYIQTAFLDGVPQDPNHPFSTQIQFDDGDGFLSATEIGYLPAEGKEDARYGKVAIGGWIYTEKFDDLVDTDSLGNPERRSSFGFYALGEYQIYREADDHEQGLKIYGRFGYATPTVHQFNYYLGAGAVYTGLIPKRDSDQLGLNVSTAINGSKYKRAQRLAAAPVKSTEVNIELTYKAQITPWLAVQPDVQYIINPGTSNVGHALQVGGRFEIVF